MAVQGMFNFTGHCPRLAFPSPQAGRWEQRVLWSSVAQLPYLWSGICSQQYGRGSDGGGVSVRLHFLPQ